MSAEKLTPKMRAALEVLSRQDDAVESRRSTNHYYPAQRSAEALVERGLASRSVRARTMLFEVYEITEAGRAELESHTQGGKDGN